MYQALGKRSASFNSPRAPCRVGTIYYSQSTQNVPKTAVRKRLSSESDPGLFPETPAPSSDFGFSFSPVDPKCSACPSHTLSDG